MIILTDLLQDLSAADRDFILSFLKDSFRRNYEIVAVTYVTDQQRVIVYVSLYNAPAGQVYYKYIFSIDCDVVSFIDCDQCEWSDIYII